MNAFGTPYKGALKVVMIVEVERVMGIEPTYAAWKATVLPLNYTRAFEALA